MFSIALISLFSGPLLAAPSAAPGLEIVDEVELLGGSLVRMQPRVEGLRVVGSSTKVLVRRDGTQAWSGTELARTELATTPSIDADAAVSSALAIRTDAAAHGEPELVVYVMPPFEPRLAYEVVVAGSIARPDGHRAYVDAHSGRVLRRVPLVHSAHARVFAANPVTTPDLSDVELPPLAGDGSVLADERITTSTCVAINTCDDESHTCRVETLAHADADGNFMLPEPEHDDPKDPFAELMAFHHTSTAYRITRELGFDVLEERPIRLVTNVTDTESRVACDRGEFAASRSRTPMENAYYGEVVVDGELESVLAYGQGEKVDWSYDGDIAYHEFGHALVTTLAPELGGGFLDELGWNSTPAGLHEGFADLVAVWVADRVNGDEDDDGKFGEYVASADGEPALRDLNARHTCPESLDGESHDDGLPFTSALWEVREDLGPEQKDRFDRAVLAALARLGEKSDLDATAAHALEEIEREWDGTKTVIEITRQALRARGLVDCDGVGGQCPAMRQSCVTRTLTVDDEGIEYLYLTGTDSVGVSPAVPAPLQLAFELEQDADGIRIDVDEVAFEGEAGEITVLVKPGDEPIEWTYEGMPDALEASSDHVLEATLAVDKKTKGKAIVQCRDDAGETTTCPAGSYQLQFADAGAAVELSGIKVTAVGAKNDAVDGDASETEAGCSCNSGGPRHGAWLLLLPLLALRRRR